MSMKMLYSIHVLALHICPVFTVGSLEYIEVMKCKRYIFYLANFLGGITIDT